MRTSLKNRAFTLVEILIVLGIIGILSAIVIDSTTTSRAKARDTRRIADMKEIQIGLALYYDVNRAYPAALSTLATQKYLPSIPNDPLGSAYEYTQGANTYCIGVTLEGAVPDDTAVCTSGSPSTANYKALPPQ
ncbi:MAG TPA: prepilin-type N-terminal cleavage/methylation domain-containing protein [Candidatus Paceibacterota bacterium]|jgi:general secretion pathway protein G|nr:prepilin-type N-terminal cleavage/methylation domain-containing protein [Candidatus Paceibacterota bacterium]